MALKLAGDKASEGNGFIRFGTCSTVHICTFAKVASSAFLYSICKTKPTPQRHPVHVFHDHDLQRMRKLYTTTKNVLFICGVRNPIDRNLSYFFQHASDNFRNTLRMRANDYRGEYCYIHKLHEKTLMQQMQVYWKQRWHNSPTFWLKEFFDILDFDERPFNHATGFTVYKLKKNGHWLLTYRFEDLKRMGPHLCKLVGIDTLLHTNNSSQRPYATRYRLMKQMLVYPEEYVMSILNDRFVSYFYTPQERKAFAARAMKKKPVDFGVRADEFRSIFLKGAAHVELFHEREPEPAPAVDPNGPRYAYCASEAKQAKEEA